MLLVVGHWWNGGDWLVVGGLIEQLCTLIGRDAHKVVNIIRRQLRRELGRRPPG